VDSPAPLTRPSPQHGAPSHLPHETEDVRAEAHVLRIARALRLLRGPGRMAQDLPIRASPSSRRLVADGPW
jgi:hypothetical protein